MSKQRLRKKVQELVELREMADELAAEINAIEDEIKAHMDKVGTDTLYQKLAFVVNEYLFEAEKDIRELREGE